MRRIELFESFSSDLSLEIKGGLVELEDAGFRVSISSVSNRNFVKVVIDNGLFFNIIDISEPILQLIDYLREKYGDNFTHTIEYESRDDFGDSIDLDIVDLEDFIKDEEQYTNKVKIKLQVWRERI